MKCPIDQTNLAMTDRNGVEVDYCPECRGVWLDRGELDKIVERAESSSSSERREQPRDSRSDDYRNDDRRSDDRRDSDHRDSDHHGYDKKKKKESFIGDLFDF